MYNSQTQSLSLPIVDVIVFAIIAMLFFAVWAGWRRERRKLLVNRNIEFEWCCIWCDTKNNFQPSDHFSLPLAETPTLIRKLTAIPQAATSAFRGFVLKKIRLEDDGQTHYFVICKSCRKQMIAPVELKGAQPVVHLAQCPREFDKRLYDSVFDYYKHATEFLQETLKQFLAINLGLVALTVVGLHAFQYLWGNHLFFLPLGFTALFWLGSLFVSIAGVMPVYRYPLSTNDLNLLRHFESNVYLWRLGCCQASAGLLCLGIISGLLSSAAMAHIFEKDDERRIVQFSFSLPPELQHISLPGIIPVIVAAVFVYFVYKLLKSRIRLLSRKIRSGFKAVFPPKPEPSVCFNWYCIHCPKPSRQQTFNSSEALLTPPLNLSWRGHMITCLAVGLCLVLREMLWRCPKTSDSQKYIVYCSSCEKHTLITCTANGSSQESEPLEQQVQMSEWLWGSYMHSGGFFHKILGQIISIDVALVAANIAAVNYNVLPVHVGSVVKTFWYPFLAVCAVLCLLLSLFIALVGYMPIVHRYPVCAGVLTDLVRLKSKIFRQRLGCCQVAGSLLFYGLLLMTVCVALVVGSP